jgi:hypothetical protein
VAVVVYGVFNRRGYGRALALGGATPVGAAFVVGAIAVPTFYAVAVGAVAGVVLRLLQRSRQESARTTRPVTGSRLLVLFVVGAVLTTLVAPLLFNGLPVLRPEGEGAALAAGVVTKSNLAQLAYLLLSVAVVAFLARSRWAGPELVGTATCLATLLSLWSWAHLNAGLPYPEGVFDNSPAFAFIQTLPGGAPRVRGIFSEPAGLASSCLVTIAYCASRFGQVQGVRRLGVLLVGAAALFLGSISTSTTFLIAGIALVAVAAVVTTSSFVLRGGSLQRSAVSALCAAALASLFLLPYLAAVIGKEVGDKVGSSSYVDRSSSDSVSLRLLLDTFGIGTGVGANRGSSFFATLLSTVGIVGTVLFVAVVVVLVRGAWNVRQARPAAWALIALLIAKAVSGPELSDSTGVLWLSLGVLAHAASRVERRSVPRTGSAVGTSPGAR